MIQLLDLLSGGWTEAQKEEHFARGYAPYWLSFDPDTLARQAELVRRAEHDHQPLAIEHRVDSHRSVTEVTIYTLDTHGLFARLAGAMAISGANIVDAKIFTLANGMALDTFWIQDLEGKPFDGPQRLARLSARVELFTTSIAIVFSFGPKGFISHDLLGLENVSAYGYWSTALAETLTYFPIGYLTLRPILAAIDPNLEEMAFSLRASPCPRPNWRIWRASEPRW